MSKLSISKLGGLSASVRNRVEIRGIGSCYIFAFAVVSAVGCSILTKGDLPQCVQDEDCARSGLLNASCDKAQHVCVAPYEKIVPEGTAGARNEGDGSDGSTSGGVAGAAGQTGSPGMGGVTVAWSGGQEREALGDSAGGGYYGERCGTGEVLVGLGVGAGMWFDRIIGICQRIGVTTDDETMPPNTLLVFGQKRELPAHPAGTGNVHDLSCPEGHAVVGIRISQQNHSAAGNDYVVIPRVWVTCGELFMSGPDGQVGWRNEEEIGPVSGSVADNTAWFASDAVSASQVAVGIHGMGGSWIDRIGLVSADLAVTWR